MKEQVGDIKSSLKLDDKNFHIGTLLLRIFKWKVKWKIQLSKNNELCWRTSQSNFTALRDTNISDFANTRFVKVFETQ